MNESASKIEQRWSWARGDAGWVLQLFASSRLMIVALIVFSRQIIVLALLSCRWKWIYEPLLAFSIGLLALCTVLFANAYQMT